MIEVKPSMQCFDGIFQRKKKKKEKAFSWMFWTEKHKHEITGALKKKVLPQDDASNAEWSALARGEVS